MKRPTLTRWAMQGAGAIFALLALSVLAPGSASGAGCFQTHGTASHFDLLIEAGAMSADRDEGMGSEATPPGKLPSCNGPMCSKGPAAPPSSSWTTPTGLESWACLAEHFRADPQPRSPLPAEASPQLPTSRGLAIFHPPRRRSA